MSAIGPVRRAAASSSEWETPWPLFRAIDQEFRFTIDAAASASNHKCDTYLTIEDDALKVDLVDQCVWVNPPYGNLKAWAVKFAAWSMLGSTVVALLPANTDTEWFRACWFWSHEIRFLAGRVSFVGSRSGNTGGSMLVIYRPQPLFAIEEGDVTVELDQPVPPRVSLWDWREDARVKWFTAEDAL